MAWLLAFDLSGFDVRKAPRTDGLVDQQIVSLRGIDKWWHALLVKGRLPVAFFDETAWEEQGQRIQCDLLRGDYVQWLKEQRFGGDPVNESHFGRQLKRLCPAVEIQRPAGQPRPPRVYVLPNLNRARELFCAHIGGKIDWDA